MGLVAEFRLNLTYMATKWWNTWQVKKRERRESQRTDPNPHNYSKDT